MSVEELLRKTEESELFKIFGIRIESAVPGHVVLTMPVTPRVHQYIGIMNGVSVLLAESAADGQFDPKLVKMAPHGERPED